MENQNKQTAELNNIYNGSDIKVLEVGASYAIPVCRVSNGALSDTNQDVIIPFVRGVKQRPTTKILSAKKNEEGILCWAETVTVGDKETFIYYGLEADNIIYIPVKLIDGKYYLQLEGNQPIDINPAALINEDSELLDLEAELMPEVAYLGAIQETEEVPAQDGVTTRALLQMLIHATKVKHQELPSRQSAIAITKLEEAYFWLTHRMDERKARGVLNTQQA